MLRLTENHLLRPAPPAGITVGRVEAELRRLPHLSADRRLIVNSDSRRMVDARKIQTAREAIGMLPGPNETIHLLISGKYALWNLAEALIEMAGPPADELLLTTLSFSKKNIDALCGLLDSGQVKTALLICSHYFRGTSPVLYAHGQIALGKRPRASFMSCRNHAKIVAVKFPDGRMFTVSSSANLRSAKSIEAATIDGNSEVFEFHRRWICDLFAAREVA